MAYSNTYGDTYVADSDTSVSVNVSSDIKVAASYTTTVAVAIPVAARLSSSATGGEAPATPDTPYTDSDIIRSSFLQIEPVVSLLDKDLVFIKDISDEIHSLSVSHDNLASISGQCRFRSEGDYQWSSFRIKIEVILTGLVNGVERSSTFSLGIYVPQMPAESDRSLTPITSDVECFAPTYIYKTPRSNSYDAPEGTSYLTALTDLIDSVGWPSKYIDQSAASDLTPTDFVWLLEDRNTELRIINDLLLGINYQELYADRNGQLIAEPFVFPQDKSPTWTFTEDADTSTIVGDVVQTKDYAEVPNQWTFVLDDPTGDFPTVENGRVYIVTNQSDGVTSIDERGYVVNTVETIEYSHCVECFQVTANKFVDRSKYPIDQVTLTSTINPLFFHYDVATVDTPSYGIANTRYFVESWNMDFNSLTQTFDMRKVP